MPWSITLGRVAGTAVRIHLTFLLFLAWIGLSSFAQDGAVAARNNLIFMLALFLCVVLHEFGHIFAARAFGIATPDVTLYPIGGVARLERLPENPWQELLVALAGPMVNFVIALLIVGLTGAAMPDNPASIDNGGVDLFARLAFANGFLALFNLVPAFPMDGGRVLHALLAMRLGVARATQIAARVGQALAFLLGFLGLFGNPMLLFIAVFIFVAAGEEASEVALRGAVAGLRVGDAMETRFASIAQNATIGEAVDLLLESPQHEFPVVDADKRPVSILTRESIIAALAGGSRDAQLSVPPRNSVETVSLDDDLAKCLERLRSSRSPAVAVVDSEGRMAGLFTLANLANMMLISRVRPDWRFKRTKTPAS